MRTMIHGFQVFTILPVQGIWAKGREEDAEHIELDLSLREVGVDPVDRTEVLK